MVDRNRRGTQRFSLHPEDNTREIVIEMGVSQSG
jgi:hypothetical protein